MDEKNTCCFFGHRKIPEKESIKSFIEIAIEELITKKHIKTFLFGSKSQFDDICYGVVSALKVKYPYIERIYVRAEFQHIDDSYKSYLLENYEDSYYPKSISNAGKYVYVERNQEMINKSSFCICYYDKNYLPSRRKNSKRDLTDYQPKSGTKVANDYAVRKKKTIINKLDD